MQTIVELLKRYNHYNQSVNSDLIHHLMREKAENERINVLISHIISAHQVWLERIQKKSMTVKVFDVRDFNDLLIQNDWNFQSTLDIIEKNDLESGIQYVNTKRQRFENTITEMFLHLFNHGSYHRGQINQLLVQEGKAAMVSDFIVYNRHEIV